jgi:[ribosomal protein S5]-alanine N-acetyltransferase
MIFETQRLVIRELCKDDLMDFHDLHRNHLVMQFTSGKVQSFEESQGELNHLIASYSIPNNTFRVWAVMDKQGKEFIGTTAIILSRNDENDIGYRLREKHWGKGYGKEVAEGLIHYAFSHLGLEELVGVSDVRNKASVKILESTMKFEKEFYNDEMNCIDRIYRLSKNNQ